MSAGCYAGRLKTASTEVPQGNGTQAPSGDSRLKTVDRIVFTGSGGI
jgi:hypothetical protein